MSAEESGTAFSQGRSPAPDYMRQVWLNDRDNAMLCLYLNECRTAYTDIDALLEITEACMEISDIESARRCFQKAAAIPDSTGHINDFLQQYQHRNLLSSD